MSKLLKATHEGKLTIGETTLNCAVLEDGTRVISRNAIFKAFGRTQRGRSAGEDRTGLKMPSFIDANNLQPFIDEDLRGELKRLTYLDKTGKKEIEGYNAYILPLLCKVYHDARANNALKKSQEALARMSEILLFSFSKIGIIALIDEATGYQHDREAQELQTILKLMVREDIGKWGREFYLGFYKEMFRLWGVPFTAENIRRKPPFIGHLTNTFVYNNLPKGSFVLKKLKEKTPITAGGNWAVKLHQLLTPFGKEQLRKVITSIETLASISHTKEAFKQFVSERYGQTKLNFPEIDKVANEETKHAPTIKTTFDTQLKSLLSVPPPPKRGPKKNINK